jgi:membrane protease YdiL (CAAX protease family)
VRRRRAVVAATLVVGASLLAATLAAPRGSSVFYVVGFALAAVWVAGSLASGPLHLGRLGDPAAVGGDAPPPGGRRTVVAPLLLGVASYLVFLGLYLVARELPGLSGALETVLGKADAGALGLVLGLALANAVAEEVFFRGALHAAVGDRRAPVVATGIYVLVTVASLNAALVAAAAVMGTVFTLERLATRGILAPIVTHLTWSTLMLLALPR